MWCKQSKVPELDSWHCSGQRPLDKHTSFLQTIPQLQVMLLDLTPPSKASLYAGEGYTARYPGQNQTQRFTQCVLKHTKKVCRHTFLCEALSMAASASLKWFYWRMLSFFLCNSRPWQLTGENSRVKKMEAHMHHPCLKSSRCIRFNPTTRNFNILEQNHRFGNRGCWMKGFLRGSAFTHRGIKECPG